MSDRDSMQRILIIFVTLLLMGLGHAAVAQTYPAKPIRFIVPFPVGGVADVFARVIGGKLNEAWGQPVVVENRTGAGGNIGAETVAKAPPDGYTLVMGSIGTHAVNVSLFKRLPYDPVKDFAPVALVLEADGEMESANDERRNRNPNKRPTLASLGLSLLWLTWLAFAPRRADSVNISSCWEPGRGCTGSFKYGADNRRKY